MTAATRTPATMSAADTGVAAFGELTPLLAPQSVAVIGASDRDGSLGGLAVGFLAKFRYLGSVWPVNPTRATVGALACYPRIDALPGVPDLALIAVPAEAVQAVVQDCADAGVPAAIVWAGGFAETDAAGRARQRELEALCRTSGILLCGPNCIGVINTSIGLTASFSSMLTEHAELTPGVVSMVSQSGGIAVMAHSRAQAFGLGFRVTVSCGNEAALGLADFIRALVHDDGTRVIAVYAEGLSDPEAFVAALSLAREREEPVIVLKGAALAEVEIGELELAARRSPTRDGWPAVTARSTPSAASSPSSACIRRKNSWTSACNWARSVARSALPATACWCPRSAAAAASCAPTNASARASPCRRWPRPRRPRCARWWRRSAPWSIRSTSRRA